MFSTGLNLSLTLFLFGLKSNRVIDSLSPILRFSMLNLWMCCNTKKFPFSGNLMVILCRKNVLFSA